MQSTKQLLDQDPYQQKNAAELRNLLEKHKQKKVQKKKALNETILEELEMIIHTGVMDNIQRGDPEVFKHIVLGTEAQLYKHKRRLYPHSINNQGEGYS